MDNQQQDQRDGISWRSWLMIVAGGLLFFCVGVPAFRIANDMMPYVRPYLPWLAGSALVSVIIAIPMWVIGGPIAFAMWLRNLGWVKRFNARKIQPTQNNSYARIYESPGVITMSPNSEPPQFANLQSLTWSPRDSSRREIKEVQEEQKQLPSPHIEQPRLETIIEQLTENALQVPFGVHRETGQLVTTTLTKAVHLSSIGDSGGGKSCGAQGILTSLAVMNDTEHLQFAFIDAESETTLPFRQLPQVGYLADDPRDAARILAELVQLKRRRDITKIALPFVLLFVEEFLVLRKQIPASLREQALENFTELACTGRKRNIAIYTIGQTGYSEKAIRDAQAQFQTNMAYPIHPQKARAAGFIETPLLNQLYKEKRTGQFVLEHRGDNAIIQAPYIDTKTVSSILVPGECRVSAEPVPGIDSLSNGHQDGQQPAPTFETLELVRKMVLDEKGVKEIASVAFPNMRDSDAAKEVRRCMRQLVQRD